MSDYLIMLAAALFLIWVTTVAFLGAWLGARASQSPPPEGDARNPSILGDPSDHPDKAPPSGV